MIKEYAYAKINLALEVKDTDNGYHFVNNLMIPISLCDVLTFEEYDELYLENNKIADNIILKAAKLFMSHFNINKGVKITIDKHIPVAAGLAGGSTDAASTLLGLNKLFNVNAGIEELKLLAACLGSDVPFFIEKKLALCTHYGEVINNIDIDYNNFDLLIIKPNSGLSTKLVYDNYVCDNVDKKNKIDNIIEALKTNDLNLLEENIFNDLEPVSLKLNNDLLNIYNDLKKDNNIHVSGSGPSMFIINPKDISKILSKYKDIFVYSCKTLKP